MSTRDSTDTLIRTVVLILAVVVLVPLLVMVFAMPMMGMMGWWGGRTGTVSPLWGLGSMLLVLLVLVGVGYYFTRSLSSATGHATDPALEELRVAYARGDLSDEEFERRRERLTRSDRE